MKIDEYKVQAQLNRNKKADEFSIGDFLLTATACGKDCNFIDFIDAHENWNIGINDRVCKVVEIIDVTEDEDFLTDWLNKEATPHEGGSESDDVDTSKKMYEYTKADCATFFDLITVLRKPSGKWIGVDCQGYAYWRHVHLPSDYENVFAEERADALSKLAEVEAKRQAEKMKELEHHANALRQREAELRSKYFGMVLDPANSRVVGNNVRKFFAIEFPDIKVKVRVKKSYWGDKFDVFVDVIGVQDYEKRDAIRKVCKVWTDTMPTGRMTDANSYAGETETRMCPMQMFGIVNGTFSFNFE